MRLLKVVLAVVVTAVALLFSAVVAVGLLVTGLLAYVYLRFRRKPGRPAPAAGTASSSAVIDVTATEVPATRLERQ